MVNLTLALCAFLHVGQILVHGLLLFRCGELLHQLALRCQHHEGDTEDSVGASRKNGKVLIAVCYVKLHLRTLTTAYPVALSFLDRIAPFNFLKAVEETLCKGTNAQAPLAHLLLLHREATAHANTVHHLIIG